MWLSQGIAQSPESSSGMRTLVGGGGIDCQVRPSSVVCAIAGQRPDFCVQPTVPSAHPCLPTKVRSATRNPLSGPDRGTGGALVGGATDEAGGVTVVDAGIGEPVSVRSGVDGALPLTVPPPPLVEDVHPASRNSATAARRRRFIRGPPPASAVRRRGSSRSCGHRPTPPSLASRIPCPRSPACQ